MEYREEVRPSAGENKSKMFLSQEIRSPTSVGKILQLDNWKK